MNTSPSDTQRATDVVTALLCGAQLDTIRVHSLIVQIGFVCLGRAGDLPSEVWVSVSGALLVNGDKAIVPESVSSRDFFESRASAIGAIYRLIGQEVTAARVLDSGALQIHLGGTCVLAESDEEVNLEEVWSVLSDTPVTASDHQWHVSLSDSGELSMHVPS